MCVYVCVYIYICLLKNEQKMKLLPSSLICYSFQFLNLDDHSKLRQTCKYFKNCSKNTNVTVVLRHEKRSHYQHRRSNDEWMNYLMDQFKCIEKIIIHRRWDSNTFKDGGSQIFRQFLFHFSNSIKHIHIVYYYSNYVEIILKTCTPYLKKLQTISTPQDIFQELNTDQNNRIAFDLYCESSGDIRYNGYFSRKCEKCDEIRFIPQCILENCRQQSLNYSCYPCLKKQILCDTTMNNNSYIICGSESHAHIAHTRNNIIKCTGLISSCISCGDNKNWNCYSDNINKQYDFMKKIPKCKQHHQKYSFSNGG